MRLGDDVYAMHMFSELLQLLVTPEQRRRLEAEARRRDTSVASLVREAVDARYATATRDERLAAAGEIARLEGSFLEPSELNRLVEEERDAALGHP